MARIFQTGLELGSSAIFSTFNGGIVTSPVAGAWSVYSLRGSSGGGNNIISMDASVSELYFGARLRFTSIAARNHIHFLSPNATEQVSLRQAAGGQFTATRNGTVLTGGTGTVVPSVDTWYYVEGHIIVSDTVGVFEVKIDGVQDINVTGADTKNDGATSNIDRLNLMSSSTAQFLDDMYVNDTTGSQNTGYSGDQRLKLYVPNAAGDVTGLTRGGTDSGNNYGQVDEVPTNDGTDYVFGTDTTSYDLYNIPNTSGVATVQAATLWARALKSDAGAASLALVLKSGGTENFGSDVALSTSYAFYHTLYNNDPTDSAAWSASKIDSLQIGIKSR